MKAELHPNQETLILISETVEDAFLLGEISKSNRDVSTVYKGENDIQLSIRLSRLLKIASNYPIEDEN